MYIDYFEKYPELKDIYQFMRSKYRDEVMDSLKQNNNYANLIKDRTNKSMILHDILIENNDAFEDYMDLVYEQEILELDAVYDKAFCDALLALKEIDMI